MAHSCPECSQACYCGGDIDDIEIDGTVEQLNCVHCDEDGDDLDDDDEDWLEHGYEVED